MDGCPVAAPDAASGEAAVGEAAVGEAAVGENGIERAIVVTEADALSRGS